MSKQLFQTYWIVSGIRCESYHTMRQRVLTGATAIEVSAECQQAAAERRAEQANANAIKDEKIRKAAAQRAHDQSPEGQLEAAHRTALNNPGGIVSGGVNRLAELDVYSPAKTNLLK